MAAAQTASTRPDPPPRPAFSSLTLDPSGPPGNTWGLFGPEDELGQLNYITAGVTAAAAAEGVRSGVRVPVDLPVDFFDPPSFQRIAPQHTIEFVSAEAAAPVHDDTLLFNTQSSTQWDGFRHVGYWDPNRRSDPDGGARWYNGLTRDDVATSSKMGTHAWAQAGGFATRGVLLDYAGWAASQGLSRPAFSRTPITAAELRSVAAWSGVTLRTGDVLMVRTGYLAQYGGLERAERERRHADRAPPTIGLDQSEDMVRLLWEGGVVAVAADSPSLEAWPWVADGPAKDYSLHKWFLAAWGLPIGEYFDLETLAHECRRHQRWTFFFTSMPLNVPGGVGTPVNGICIF